MEIHLFSQTLNTSGIIVGAAVFLLIVISRWLCILGEYHFGKKFWIAFLLIGLPGILASFFISNIILSTLAGVTGFIFLWGIHETIEQEERVNKGWFPKKPKRIKDTNSMGS